jgi:hypothetical protein
MCNIEGVTYEGTIMTYDLGNGRIRRFGLCKYDGKYGYYRPVSPLTVDDFLITETKKEMIPHAKRLHYPQNHIYRIGNAFRYSWGLLWDLYFHWFVLKED